MTNQEFMKNSHLENKLVEFKVHYSSLASAIAVLYSAIQNDMDGLKYSDVEARVTLLDEMTAERTELFNNIITEFQDSYCK